MDHWAVGEELILPKAAWPFPKYSETAVVGKRLYTGQSCRTYLTSPSTLQTLAMYLFLFVRVFLTPERTPKAQSDRSLDVIGHQVQILLAACMFFVQNGRMWGRVIRYATPLELAEIGRLNGDTGN